jgi:acetate---CoA ligase (ADP-forming)
VSLAAVLDPRSVAVIGASEQPDKIGGRPLVHLARNGFRGTVYPVNPRRQEVQGLRCYPDIAALPEAPEVAVVVVAGAAAVDAVGQLAAAGTAVAIVMASGFGEAGPDGKAMEQEMLAAAGSTGMRVIGPNCLGVCNFGTGAVLTFTTAFLEVPRLPGPIAIASQSGSMAVEPYLLLARQGFGVCQVHATGNDCDVTVAEMGALAAADPDVELLLLYLESVNDLDALCALGRIARERDLPVVALKAGHTAAGQIAARSHTGAVASEDRVVDAFLEREGIWRARDVDDLVRATSLHLRHWRPRGVSVAVLSNSGASCVQSADAIEGIDLELAALSDATRDALDTTLPSYATTTNPVDLTAALIGNPQFFTGALDALASDPGVDAIHFALPVAGRGYDIATFASALATVALEMPVVVSCPMPDSVVAPFVEHELPLFAAEPDAIAALASHLGLRRRLARARARAERAPVPRVPGDGRMLDEHASLELIARAGVPVVAHRLCRTADDAVAAFDAFGAGAVAVKGCSASIGHKSELGIVRLGLTAAAEVASAFHDIARILQDHDPDAPGVLVAPMVRGRRELLLGARHDPTFGPIVVVGDGGAYVEAMPDIAVLIPPFDADDVRAALDRLRIAPLFAGVRGEPPMDVAAFADAALAVGRLIGDPASGLVDLDVNPVMIRSAGDGCVALDAVTRIL